MPARQRPLNGSFRPVSETWAVAATGAALSLGLFVAIGAQNASVRRQGLRREHVGAIVAFCALSDAA